jgi:DNA-binding NarL/FixJ family response regulator
MSTVQILLADDHSIVRAGVRAVLEQQPGWVICGEASSGPEAIEQAEKLAPDIIIMDIGMPELNGLDATRRIKRLHPKIEVLIFTANETEDVVRNVFKAGARGYLLKSDATKHLVPAVEALVKKRTYFSSRVSELVFSGYLKEDGDTAEDSALTSREREVVQLVAEGKSSKEVASLLGISVKTVETHRATIMRKLQLRSVADLVRYAVRNGIVTA